MLLESRKKCRPINRLPHWSNIGVQASWKGVGARTRLSMPSSINTTLPNSWMQPSSYIDLCSKVNKSTMRAPKEILYIWDLIFRVRFQYLQHPTSLCRKNKTTDENPYFLENLSHCVQNLTSFTITRLCKKTAMTHPRLDSVLSSFHNLEGASSVGGMNLRVFYSLQEDEIYPPKKGDEPFLKEPEPQILQRAQQTKKRVHACLGHAKVLL